MTTPIPVTAGIIKKNDKFLIAQRKEDSSVGPGKWEFPGGKIEFWENPKQCLKREIKEELNIEIKVEDFLTYNSHVYEKDEKIHVLLLAFICQWKKRRNQK